VSTLPAGAKVTLLSPIVEQRKGEFVDVLEDLKRKGFVRVRIDGLILRLEDVKPLDKKKKHDIAIVVDRLTITNAHGQEEGSRARLTDGVETALRASGGKLVVEEEGSEPRLFSESRTCPRCDVAVPELSPQSLSYNSPLGMCPECSGLGTRLETDPKLLVPDPTLTIDEGAIAPWRNVAESEGWTSRIVGALCKDLGIARNVPYGKLPKQKRDMLMFGTGDRRIAVSWSGKHSKGSWAMRWEGLCPQMRRRFETTQSESMQKKYKVYLREAHCSACDGTRLRPEARAVFLGGKSLPEVSQMTITEAAPFFDALDLEGAKKQIAEEILKEIRHRLAFLLGVGLEYLSLSRATMTLSGGEAQRIRLAAQLGSELSGVMYVLDEPSIGLHPRDNTRLVSALTRLRDLGNTVIVVEHDEETILAADHVVDFGPGAGRLGGRVVAEGTARDIMKNKASLTGDYLAGRKKITEPRGRRTPSGWLTVKHATENNLRDVTVKFPLGVFCAVTGVSGAGKSTLVGQILEPAVLNALHKATHRIGAHEGIAGIEQLDKAIVIDQNPIGRTPRSNPATYTKLFDLVREVFAGTKEARAFGYGAGRFSFNVKGGRCESCEGGGMRAIEMHFLPDVWVTCETCKGKRYNEATLRVLFKGKSIADVLAMQVKEARELFANVPHIQNTLATLEEVGLGYVALGQPATTLSGGEAQRIKLSKELSRRDTGNTLYILDEPTTGLHFDDVKKLLVVLQKLVDAGNTVLVVEHNLDVVRAADYIIDLGPEGGAGGGMVIAEGTPEAVAKVARSYTGKFLAERATT
jgi:excinuclease ABC subunit A